MAPRTRESGCVLFVLDDWTFVELGEISVEEPQDSSLSTSSNCVIWSATCVFRSR